MNPRRHTLRALAAVAAAALALPALAADGFPKRPLTIVVPFPAGGITDQIARGLAERLQASLGQTVIVDNKPGAGGQIAAAQLKQADADGHTLFMGATEMFAINRGLYRKLSYDPLADFAPVTPLFASSLVLVVPQSGPVKTLPELIAAAKARPLNFASQGMGSIGHLLGEQFRGKVGGSYSHIAYKGSAPALQDVMGGQVDMMFDPVITTAPLIAGAKLRPLAIAAKARSTLLAQVPTLAELGVPDVDAAVWFGAVVKTGTPAPIVARLNEEITKLLRDPAFSKRFADQGLEPMPMTPTQFDGFLRAEVERWGALVKASGATID